MSGPQLISLLNSRLLDEIAAAALRVEQLVDPPRAYVSETLHLYLTLTNLRGVPYEVTFKGGAYHMLSHGDRVHYAVTGLGGWPTTSAFADNDRYRPLAAAALKNPPSDEWVRLTASALASAAFPVGLAPRLIQARPDEYAGAAPPETLFRRFPDDNLADRGNINPSWSDLSEFSFMTVDGGTIDNDPFEYARFTLKKGGQSLAERIEWRLDKADRAVIMISPFPDGAQMRPDGAPAPDILSIVSTLAPALIEQARFKPSELVLAADPEHGSRFLVAPKRYEAGAPAPYPIASGLLGGFGGFVAEAFRAHDFQLGRRNCQKFLRGTFALPASNELFRNWPAAAFGADFQSTDEEAGETEKFYCLIPLFGAAASEAAEPDWPRIGKKDLDAMQNKIGQSLRCGGGGFPRRQIQGFMAVARWRVGSAPPDPQKGAGFHRGDGDRRSRAPRPDRRLRRSARQRRAWRRQAAHDPRRIDRAGQNATQRRRHRSVHGRRRRRAADRARAGEFHRRGGRGL